MKSKLLIIGASIALILASCSPAQIASGTFSGGYTASGFPNSSGTATVTISENGADMVNIVANASGNPEISVSGITVTKIALPGITQVSFYKSGDIMVDGFVVEVGGIKTVDLEISNSLDTTSFSFSGTKL